MLIDIDANKYYSIFPADPHPFISRKFVDLNKYKVDRVFMLVEDNSKPSLGLIAGLKDGYLNSPFSSPFGGVHFRHELIYFGVIKGYIESLKDFIRINGLKGIQISLPPSIYHQTINSKFINCLFNSGFKIQKIDITSWVDLESFENRLNNKESRKYLNQAIHHGLNFKLITQNNEKLAAFELIKKNRLQFGRPIFLSFDDLQKTNDICDIDYFAVDDQNHQSIASAIFYRAHKSIVYGVFWGDNEIGRSQRAMNFLLFNLWKYYKQSGFKYIDLGISTENGIPNESLLRFKESNEAISSLRYTFIWSNDCM